MALVRPEVNVFSCFDAEKVISKAPMPEVLKAPLRPDIVQSIFFRMRLSERTPHGRKPEAGYLTAAASWGTGRAVARIPRVHGSGTHRAGQGAFGNMCRGGGMFAPIKSYRKLTRKSNLKLRKYAIQSALAASALPAVVTGRGHRIDAVPELPLVVGDEIESIRRTREAVALFKLLGLGDELKKVIDSRCHKTGVKRSQTKSHKMRKGPLVVYHSDENIALGFRNIPGVDVICVKKLELSHLAPGGVAGRVIVWSKSAFEYLDTLFGENGRDSVPKSVMCNADIERIINSDEVQSALEFSCEKKRYNILRQVNSYKNEEMRVELDPLYKKRDEIAKKNASALKDRLSKVKVLAQKRMVEIRKSYTIHQDSNPMKVGCA